MKQGTMNILFFVLKTKLLKNGEAPILMRVTINGNYDDAPLHGHHMDGNTVLSVSHTDAERAGRAAEPLVTDAHPARFETDIIRCLSNRAELKTNGRY